MTASKPIGMVGLGLMGSALTERLIGAGLGVAGFDVDAEKQRVIGGLAIVRVGALHTEELGIGAQRLAMSSRIEGKRTWIPSRIYLQRARVHATVYCGIQAESGG